MVAVAVAVIMMAAAFAALNFTPSVNDGNEYRGLGDIGDKFDDGLFEYEVTFESGIADERTAMITGRLPALEAEVIGNGGLLELPSAPVTHNGKTYNVTAIKDSDSTIFGSGYLGVFEMMTSIESIDFGSVTYIGALVFSQCTSLKELRFADSVVTRIAGSAFKECTSLESVDFSNSAVTDIGVAAFRDCILLNSVDFSNSAVTDIGVQAFYDCRSLRSIDLSGSAATYIGYYAFSGCSALEYMSVPSSVTYLGTRAFENCSNIKIITMPQTLETLWTSALYNGRADLIIFFDTDIKSIVPHAGVSGRADMVIRDISGNVPALIDAGTSAGGSDLNVTLSFAGGTWSLSPGANAAVYIKPGNLNLTGVISDDNGIPIKNVEASYEIYRTVNTSSTPDAYGYVITDIGGNYTISGVPMYAKIVITGIEHDDYLYVDAELPFVITSVEDDDVRDFVMHPCFRIFLSTSMNGKILMSYDSVTDELLTVTGSKKLLAGTAVILKASPVSEDHTFSFWAGDVRAGENNPYTYTVSSDMTVGAVFAYTGGTEGIDYFTITYDTATANGTVMWSLTGDDGDWQAFMAGDFMRTFPSGTEVHLRATADAGHEFMVWTGDVPVLSTNPYVYTGTASITVGAIFDIGGTEGIDYFVIALGTTTYGNVRWSTDGVAYNNFLNIAGVFMKRFPIPSAGVYLEAVGDEGYGFSYWTYDVGAGEKNPYVYTGTASITVGAVFYHDDAGGTYHFTVTYDSKTKNGTVMWSLTRDDGDWWAFPESGAGVFEKTFPDGHIIFIKAIGDSGYEFSYWTGDVGAGENNPYAYTEADNITVGAVFYNSNGTKDLDHFTITYDTATANGIVAWSLTGDDGDWWAFRESRNPGVFEETFPSGLIIFLKAFGDIGYELSYWSGDVGAGENNPYTYGKMKDMTVGAVFYHSDGTKGMDYFTITYDATANGIVMWSPTGKDGDWWAFHESGEGVFEKTFPDGCVIYIKAFADKGYKFSYWAGDVGAGENNPYAHTDSASMTVGAIFSKDAVGGAGSWLWLVLFLLTLAIPSVLIIMNHLRRKADEPVADEGGGL
jgi:hypothetical protein